MNIYSFGSPAASMMLVSSLGLVKLLISMRTDSEQLLAKIFRVARRDDQHLYSSLAAVSDAACTIMVTASATLICSMIRSERSGSIVIGSHWLKKMFYWKFCSVLYSTTLPSSRLRENQHMLHRLVFPSKYRMLCLDPWLSRPS